jgi:hypothetical protein
LPNSIFQNNFIGEAFFSALTKERDGMKLKKIVYPSFTCHQWDPAYMHLRFAPKEAATRGEEVTGVRGPAAKQGGAAATEPGERTLVPQLSQAWAAKQP